MKRSRSITKITAVVLAAVLIFSLTGCIRIEINLGKKTSAATETSAYQTPETEISQETTPAPNPNVSDVTTAETAESAETQGSGSSGSSSSSGKGSSLRPVYEEADTSVMKKLCDELTALASGSDQAAIISKYDEVYAEYARLYDIDNAAYLDYCDNVSDELSDRYEAADKMITEAYDMAMTAILAVTQGPSADAFRSHVGDVEFESFSSYEPMTAEDFARSERETSLVTSYYDAVDKADSTGMSDEELNRIVGPIYLELVKLRNEEAKEMGYDNFADYADEQIYMRDYDGESAAKLHETVKAIGSRYYSALYGFYWGDYYSLGDDITDMDDIMEILEQYGKEIDPVVVEALNYMKDNKLYDVTGGSNRRQGAYTIEFTDGTPYIFATLGDEGFSTINHEFGHFTASYVNPNPNILVSDNGSLDICEIHSNGLEGLYTKFYPEIYGGDDANLWTNSLLLELMSNVVDGCIFDEFQREVYKNPDMTLEQVNQLYLDICKAYGDPYAESYQYWWQQVHHNFESPMYYFSYAASGFVALQIWAISQNNFDYACDIWKEIIDAGPYDYGYLELIDNLGLQDFTDTKAAGEVLDAVMDEIESNSSSGSGFPGISDLFPGGLGDDGKGDDEEGFDIEDYINDIFGDFFNQFGGQDPGAGGR